MKYSFAGLYQFEKFRVDSDGNEVPGTRTIVSPWNDNLITDAGLNYLGSTSHDNLNMCRIGTGNAEPAVTDTALGAQVATTTTAGVGNATGYNTTDRFLWRRVSRRFAAGSASGVNLTEVGMAASNSVSLFSRSLIKDSGGSPTAITLAPDEVLDVLYELRMYLPPQSQVVNATIDGVASTVTIQVTENENNLASWALFLGNRFALDMSAPSNSKWGAPLENAQAVSSDFGNGGDAATGVTVVTATYVAGSFTTALTITLGLTSGNFTTGVGALKVAGGSGGAGDSRWKSAYGWWQYVFSPKLNKTSTRTATIKVGITWGRR